MTGEDPAATGEDGGEGPASGGRRQPETSLGAQEEADRKSNQYSRGRLKNNRFISGKVLHGSPSGQGGQRGCA